MDNSWVLWKNEVAMVSDNMAEDGEYVGSRYVGFGFVWNPDGDGMVVDYVVPDSPASSFWKRSDFIKVNGISLQMKIEIGWVLEVSLVKMFKLLF